MIGDTTINGLHGVVQRLGRLVVLMPSLQDVDARRDLLDVNVGTAEPSFARIRLRGAREARRPTKQHNRGAVGSSRWIVDIGQWIVADSQCCAQ